MKENPEIQMVDFCFLRLGSKYLKRFGSLGDLSLDIQVEIGVMFITTIFLPIDRKGAERL